MTIPRDLSNLAPGANTSGVLQPAKGGTGLTSPGANGNVLTSNGTAWTSAVPTGGGSWIYLSSVTASSSATVDIETTFDSTYDNYVIVANAVKVSSDTVQILCRLKINGTYQTTSYYYINDLTNSAAAPSSFADIVEVSSSATSINATQRNSFAANASANFYAYISNPASTSLNKMISFFGVLQGTTNGANSGRITGNGSYRGANSTAALTGVRFLAGSGNISSGTFRLYGIKNS